MKPCSLYASVLAVSIGVMSLPTMASAEYLLGAGDVLDIAVFGVADFKRRMTVNVDGDVSVPYLGEVHATGLSIGGLRQVLASALDRTGTMRKPDVTIELAEYRPFFIGGDVARPGAIPFRPGLTVRHAVALAGGFDALRFKAENPLLSAPEFRSQYESLWTELVRRRARAISLQAQIDGKKVLDFSQLDKAPLSSSVVREIGSLEARDFALRIAAYDRERSFLSKSLSHGNSDIEGLKLALAQQQRAITQQVAAGDRTIDAQSRGIVASVRVDEDRRSLANLRSQQTDASTRLAQATKDRDDVTRRLDGAADDYRSKLIRELQDTVVDVEKTRSQIRGVGEKLIYAGALKAQLHDGARGPEVVIFRKNGSHQDRLEASEDADVMPDDMVEVIIRPEQLVVTPSQ